MKKIVITSLLALPVLLMADMDRCVACHGVDFEKKALGVSRVVKDMSEAEIKAALDGYKKGQGGSMKDVMIKEVNVGVDTDAMAADVYNEIITPGFEEPDSEFIFKKRRTVRGMFKIKQALQKADPKKDRQKVSSQIKTFAFDLIAYDKDLRDSIDFNAIKPKMLKLPEILESVTSAKKCVDHSFTDKELHKCQKDFVTLATQISLGDAEKIKQKIKPKDKKGEVKKLPETAQEAEKALVGTWSVNCAVGQKPNTWEIKEVNIDKNLTASGWMKIYADKDCTKLIKEMKNTYTFKIGAIGVGDDGKEAWEVDKLIGPKKMPMYTMIRFLEPNRVVIAAPSEGHDGKTKEARKNHFDSAWTGCVKEPLKK